jgi:hypothetical protein
MTEPQKRAYISTRVFKKYSTRACPYYLKEMRTIVFGPDVPEIMEEHGFIKLPQSAVLYTYQETVLIPDDEGTGDIEVPLIWLDPDLTAEELKEIFKP